MTSSKAYQKLRQIQRDHCLEEDKDADVAISQRLKEVQAMVTRRAELWQVWELMSEEQKNKILQIAEIPTENLKKERRKKWKSIDLLRNAAHMCYMLVKAFVNRRAYAEPDHVPVAPAAMRRQQNVFVEDQPEPVTKSTRRHQMRTSLRFNTQLSMSIAPQLRREEDIKQILSVLRATKAFNHLFPAEMETELAKVVAYEKYDDGRIIAKQGRTPDRFYYVMTGKVHLIQEFVLNAGTVRKSMGYLTKGMTTDPNELDNKWLRDMNMVAKGQVEVLLIEKSDFARLQHTTAGPPIEFLRNIDVFHEFPCEKFLDCGDALEYRYYCENRTVVQDSNRTPWLHVIKSGCVKVIREQNVIDTSNDKLFSGRSVEELGCARPFSHADAMLGILAQQRKMKNRLTLPEISKSRRSPLNSQTSMTETVESDKRSPDPGSVGALETEVKAPVTPGPTSQQRTTLKQQKKLVPTDPLLASMVSIPIQSADVALPLGASLQRDKTNLSKPKPAVEAVHRKAYLQLDLLKTGDVFGLSEMAAKLRRTASDANKGLEHMESPLASEGPGVILVSEGAEVIRISKRFFLQHARNNTMLKIETMQREYMSEEEAIDQLYSTETWHRYKSALMSRTIHELTKP
ncbi:uncharacterized protein LOC135473570 [Liolophura sinensis]|uniref:uncharacterized protein LOC135473570 n=1 Tax=Liolophura sinensis TaxID=3198878 RepID=UPI0031582E67